MALFSTIGGKLWPARRFWHPSSRSAKTDSPSFLWQRKQIVCLPPIGNSLDVLDASVAVDMDPSAFEQRVTVWTPHGLFPVLFDVGDHFFPGAVAALGHLSGVVNAIPPEMADMFVPCAASHPARRTFNCCCHFKTLYVKRLNGKVRCRRTCSIDTKNSLVKQKKCVYSELCEMEN